MHLNPSLFEGLGIGLLFGFIIGTTWEEAFEMLKQAVEERNRKRRKIVHEEPYISEGARKWVVRLGILLAITSIMMMLIGGFMIYANTRLTNFIQCQATYNQQSYDARVPRLHASNRENRTFYAWLETLPALLTRRPNGEPADPAQLKAFRQTLLEAVHTHQENVRAQEENPLPPDPKDTCGEY